MARKPPSSSSRKRKPTVGGAGGGTGRLEKAGLPIKAPGRKRAAAPSNAGFDRDRDGDTPARDFDDDGM